jgi:hypothetical protein
MIYMTVHHPIPETPPELFSLNISESLSATFMTVHQPMPETPPEEASLTRASFITVHHPIPETPPELAALTGEENVVWAIVFVGLEV